MFKVAQTIQEWAPTGKGLIQSSQGPPDVGEQYVSLQILLECVLLDHKYTLPIL